MRICLTLHCEKLYGHGGQCARWDNATQRWIPVPQARIERVEPISEEAQSESAAHALAVQEEADQRWHVGVTEVLREAQDAHVKAVDDLIAAQRAYAESALKIGAPEGPALMALWGGRR